MITAGVAWAKTILRDELEHQDDLKTAISLEARSTLLGKGYELGNVAAFEYERGWIPNPERLSDDLSSMARLLGHLYAAESMDATVVHDEVQSVEKIANVEMAAPVRRSFRLSAPERQAIELQAMALANEYLKNEGYVVKDVSASQSYDFEVQARGRQEGLCRGQGNDIRRRVNHTDAQ